MSIYRNIPKPWKAGYAIPKYIRQDPQRRGARVTLQTPRGTFYAGDTPTTTGAMATTNYALPQNVQDEPIGQGALTTKQLPRGTGYPTKDINENYAMGSLGGGTSLSGTSLSGTSLTPKPKKTGAVKKAAFPGTFLGSKSDPILNYGKTASAWIMKNIQKVPVSHRKVALKTLLDSVDPSLWTTIEQKGTQLKKTKNLSDKDALCQAMTISLANGMIGEVMQLGVNSLASGGTSVAKPGPLLGLGADQNVAVLLPTNTAAQNAAIQAKVAAMNAANAATVAANRQANITALLSPTVNSTQGKKVTWSWDGKTWTGRRIAHPATTSPFGTPIPSPDTYVTSIADISDQPGWKNLRTQMGPLLQKKFEDAIAWNETKGAPQSNVGKDGTLLTEYWKESPQHFAVWTDAEKKAAGLSAIPGDHSFYIKFFTKQGGKLVEYNGPDLSQVRAFVVTIHHEAEEGFWDVLGDALSFAANLAVQLSTLGLIDLGDLEDAAAAAAGFVGDGLAALGDAACVVASSGGLQLAGAAAGAIYGGPAGGVAGAAVGSAGGAAAKSICGGSAPPLPPPPPSMFPDWLLPLALAGVGIVAVISMTENKP